ncbi:MAG: ribbon-helix-helix domain-containing protein [Dolichospermum sp.]
MQLEIQLDDDCVEKLAYIQQETNQDFSEAIKQAIEKYYNQVKTNNKTPLALCKELGLVGCFNGDSDVSVTYKTNMANYLQDKQELN